MAQTQETNLIDRYRDFAFKRPGGTQTIDSRLLPLNLYLEMKKGSPRGQRFLKYLEEHPDQIDQAVRNNQNEPHQKFRVPRIVLWALINSRADVIPIIKANSPFRRS